MSGYTPPPHATPAQIEQKAAEKETAVLPLSAVAVEDLGRAAQVIDDWLRSISHDLVTLEVIKNVAGSLPVVGNIMALLDVLSDIVTILTSKATDGVEAFFNWVSLGINLLGVVPLPPSMAAARMSLRPTLHLVRQELRTAAHDIGEAIVVMLVNHLNATIAGELDKFVDEAIDLLPGLLDDAAAKCEAMLGSWSDGLRKLAAGDVLAVDVPAERPRYDPRATYANFFAAAWGATKNTARKATNSGLGFAIRTSGADRLLIGNAELMKTLAAKVRDQLKKQANKEAEKSIAWILQKLKQAVLRAIGKGRLGRPTISSSNTATSRQQRPAEQLAAQSGGQLPAKGDPDRCKDCAGAATPNPGSISFATGSETFTHTDFALPGLMPIVWRRTYHSRLGAYDHPLHPANASAAPAYMGARWTGPYTTRIEQAQDGSLCYFAADGRAHRFPKLAAPSRERIGKTGQTHHDPIENLTLGRGDEGLLILGHGRDYVETFERVPGEPSIRQKAACYRLVSQRTRAGHTTELSYRHPDGQLSDIVSGDTRVSTALDEQGRIQSLWLVQDGQAVRQLAAYGYEAQADGSSDLVSAQDENEDTWRYDYLAVDGTAGSSGGKASTHLISRYTDRTGRGIYLRWMHEDGFSAALHPSNSARAKAYNERADDGSFDTTLVWNKHIRMTTVIDALGGETAYYCDILGYTYRIVHPEVRGADGKLYRHNEWFMRDAGKNIVRHVHPDGSQDSYAYDARGNLSSHTRADSSTVHFAYDQMDNLTGVRDAEGHAWKRAYEGVNLVEETDPLRHKTCYAYNDAGLPIEITDAKGGKKQLAYSAAGLLTAYTDCSGKTSRWMHDERGRLLKQVNAAGETTEYHYARGQLARVTNPDGAQEHLVHDAEGRLLVHRDPLQRETRYEYTTAGQVGRRIDANGHTIDYQWDRLGRLSALRNENGRTHSFSHDPMGRLLAEVHFDGIATRYDYTASTGVLRQVTEGGAVTQLDFDPMGRLARRSARLLNNPDADEGRLAGQERNSLQAPEEHYAYDGNGRLIEAKNDDIRLQWFHDASGNVRAEHHHYLLDDEGRRTPSPLTAVWQHSYDELGHRTQTVRPDGHRTTWLTYGAGHVHGLMLDGVEALQIERDDLHREIRRTQGNQVSEERKYDAAGRLESQVLRRAERLSHTSDAPVPNGDAFGIARKYSYDRAGQLTDIGDTRRGNLSYRYDPVGRLLQAHSRLGTETFAFDPASNILDPMASAARDPGTIRNTPAILDNLVKDYAGTHYAYDARGNMVRRLHNGQSTRFSWDALGRLTEARTQDTRTTFAYDPLGRRIAKRSEPIVIASAMDGSQYQEAEYRRQMRERGLGTVLFGWDGDQMVWESDSARQRTVHYVFEPGSFVPVLQASVGRRMTESLLKRPVSATSVYVDAEGNYDLDRDPLYNGVYEPGSDESGKEPSPLESIHYYQCDHLGTPMEMTDEGGGIAWEANYRAWGEAKVTMSEAARKSGLKNPIRFQGQYLDEEIGLHFNRFRYYDPVAGRFVSKDPIGLLGGFNSLQFAVNPVEWIDPLGLARLKGITPNNQGTRTTIEGGNLSKPVVGYSIKAGGQGPQHPVVKQMYDDVPMGERSITHAWCGEPDALSRVAHVHNVSNVDELGGVVRGGTSTTLRNDGKPLIFCDSCRIVMGRLSVCDGAKK
jgi:RHS repeat-associated protein